MIDLSNDRKSVEIQILGFIRKGQVVPYRVLQHYNHILSAQAALSDSPNPNPDAGGGTTNTEGGTSTGGSTDPTTITEGINDSEANIYLRDLSNELTEFNDFVQQNQPQKGNNIKAYSGRVDASRRQLVPGDSQAIDLIIQNVGNLPFTMAVFDGSKSSIFEGLYVPPKGVITFTGYSATLAFDAVKAVRDAEDTSFFAYRVTKEVVTFRGVT